MGRTSMRPPSLFALALLVLLGVSAAGCHALSEGTREGAETVCAITPDGYACQAAATAAGVARAAEVVRDVGAVLELEPIAPSSSSSSSSAPPPDEGSLPQLVLGGLGALTALGGAFGLGQRSGASRAPPAPPPPEGG